MTDARADDGLDPVEQGMQPHPEGGWFRETWRHQDEIVLERGRRSLATCVAFLLRPGEESAWHRVAPDELWLWQGGGPMIVTLGGDGDVPVAGEVHRLGSGGQLLVPAEVWQRAEPETATSLVACVVAPGFDYDDFTLLA